MSYNPQNPNGQATSANSAPVVVASDQSAVPVSGSVTANAGTNLNTSALALETGGNLASVATNTSTTATNTSNTATNTSTTATNTSGLNNTVGTAGSAIPSKGVVVQGSDGTNARAISTTSGGVVKVDLSGTAANGTAVKVDNSAVTQPVSGTVTANIGTSGSLALDATLTGGSQKTKIVDSGGTNVATVSAGGAVKVDNSAVTQPVSGTVTANAGTGSFTVAQSTASSLKAQVVSGDSTGATIPTDAYYQGNLAQTALPTAATAGNMVGSLADKFGRPVVIPQAMRDLVGMQDTSITVNTATTVVSAVASTKTDITSIQLSNSSATAVLATLSDGTNSYHFYVPAGDMRGAVYQVPLPATTANTAWTVTSSSAISTLYVTVVYIKNQ